MLLQLVGLRMCTLSSACALSDAVLSRVFGAAGKQVRALVASLFRVVWYFHPKNTSSPNIPRIHLPQETQMTSRPPNQMHFLTTEKPGKEPRMSHRTPLLHTRRYA